MKLAVALVCGALCAVVCGAARADAPAALACAETMDAAIAAATASGTDADRAAVATCYREAARDLAPGELARSFTALHGQWQRTLADPSRESVLDWYAALADFRVAIEAR